jgi:hypothetical protein
MQTGDAIFINILASASPEELQNPVPPRMWMEHWTPENGCTTSMDHARAHWDEMRIEEQARRARQPAYETPRFDPSDPLLNMPWRKVTEAAEALGCTRQTVYKWQKDPATMPVAERRLMAFYMLAPAHVVQAVLRLTPTE